MGWAGVSERICGSLAAHARCRSSQIRRRACRTPARTHMLHPMNGTFEARCRRRARHRWRGCLTGSEGRAGRRPACLSLSLARRHRPLRALCWRCEILAACPHLPHPCPAVLACRLCPVPALRSIPTHPSHPIPISSSNPHLLSIFIPRASRPPFVLHSAYPHRQTLETLSSDSCTSSISPNGTLKASSALHKARRTATSLVDFTIELRGFCLSVERPRDRVWHRRVDRRRL